MSKAFARHAQRGQVVPLMAVSLATLIGMAAYAVDAGVWRYQAMLAQSAADSGAIAAAANLANYASPTLSTMYAAANIDTTANGFTGGASNGALLNGVTVTVNNPPVGTGDPFTSTSVQVVVSKVLPVYFGWKSATVSASAVASNAASSNCLIALSSGAGNIVTLDASSTLSMPSCGMASNGWLEFNGSGIKLNAKSATYRLGITGSGSYGGAMPTQVAPTTGDPCSNIAGCAYLTANPPSNTCSSGAAYTTAPASNSSMVILQPGTYCFNQFTCTPGCTVFFAGGLYNFVSGFSVNGIVNFAGLAATTIYSGSSVTFGTGTVNLAAPTSGNYAGVVFYNAGGYQGLTFNSTAAINLDGLVYVPGGNVMLDGTPVTAQNLVTNTITLNANSSLSLSGTAAGGLSQ